MFKKNTKSFIKYGCFIAIIGAVILFGTDIYVKHKAGDAISSEEALLQSKEKADAILVLGAQVKPDGTPCLMLKERLNTGIQLYKEGAADRIIMSGDHGSDDYDEVNAMKSYAIDQGVPSECIFMDHAGFSTYDSIYRAKEIFQAKSKDAFAAAKLLAKKEGILVGISSGAALHGAIELAKRPENRGKMIVALLPDSGDRYYSTPLFTD